MVSKHRVFTVARVGSLRQYISIFLVALISFSLAQGVNSAPKITLERVLDGLQLPVYAATANDNTDRLFVVQLDGFVRIIEDGEILSAPFLNLDGKVTGLAGEQGMYSIVFHPNYQRNRRLFVSYTEHPSNDLVVFEHRTSIVNPNYAYRSIYSKELIRFSPAEPFHHGGQLAFGPDGFLYISVGDGGGPLASKVDGFDLSQDLTSFAGKILRIDVDKGDPYSIPEDNPFRSLSWLKTEIYALGFRNPWKFSFDQKTDTLYAGDVGNFDWEEVNRIESGGNYGWPAREGPICFAFPDSLEIAMPDCESKNYLSPLLTYGHRAFDETGGNAIVGGYVYRGETYPSLEGYYFFSDFTNGRIWVMDTEEKEAKRELVFELNQPVTSFVENDEGNLFVLTISGELYEIQAVTSP